MTTVRTPPADANGVGGPERTISAHAERINTKIIFDHIHTADFSKRPFTPSPATAFYTCDSFNTGAFSEYPSSIRSRLSWSGSQDVPPATGSFYREQKFA
jgi:thioredoxin reductase (NADPH)